MSESAAVLYLRVSSAAQVDGTSLATQERDCRACAARMGLAVRGVYRDEGRSAKSTVGRDGLAAAVSECKRSGAALLVWKFDRLARNAADALSVRDILAAKGARIVSATEGEASASPMSKMVFGIASLVAEFDNSVRAERCRSGMVARALEGYWTHKAPVGFRNARDERDRPVLVPDERTAPVVRAAFAGLADGSISTVEAVRDVMRGAGVSRERAFAIFSLPIYRGAIVSPLTGGEEVPAAFPGLVSPDVWNAARARFRTPTESQRMKSHENPATPLAGFLRCAVCGKPLVGGLSRSHTGTRFGYYRCRNSACRVSVRVERAHERVRSMLATFADCAPFLALVRANLDGLSAVHGEEEARKVAAARREATRAEERIKRAREAYLDGTFGREDYEEARRDARAALADARNTIATHERWKDRAGELVDAFVEVAKHPGGVLLLPPASLRAVCRALFLRLDVRPGGIVEPDPASAWSAISGVSAGESRLVDEAREMLNLSPEDARAFLAAARLLRA